MNRTMGMAVVVLASQMAGWAGGEDLPAVVVRRIPAADREILTKVADEYGLRGDARWLLYTIRIVEGGGPGREMGVLVPAAQRHKGDHAKSLELQARWAAGTIRKRYAGDLEAFAARWCPLNDPRDKGRLNRHWLANARAVMKECKKK